MTYEPPMSEYRASYVWRGPQTIKAETNYEDTIQNLINYGPSLKTPQKISDPFEEIVQKKLNQVPFSETGMNIPKENFEKTAVFKAKPQEIKDDKPVPRPEYIQRRADANPAPIKSARRTKTAGKPRKPRASFFKNPDIATEEQKKDLYGPFWVAWPKNKHLPLKYSQLSKVMCV